MRTTMVKDKLHIGQITLPYEVIWSEKRSTIGVELTPDKELIVRAPVTAKDEDIQRVLERKKPWLLKKLTGLEKQSSPPKEKEYYSGEKLPYNGRRYLIKLNLTEVSDIVVSLTDNVFIITAPQELNEDERRSKIRNRLLEWYKDKAKGDFTKSVEKYARKLDVRPAAVKILDSGTKWGEAKNKVVSLHWKLILAPVKIQDYVIVHELIHFKHKNHTNSFWNTVGSILPDYEERKDWLRVNGARLEI